MDMNVVHSKKGEQIRHKRNDDVDMDVVHVSVIVCKIE